MLDLVFTYTLVAIYAVVCDAGCLQDHHCFAPPPSQSFICSSYTKQQLQKWKKDYSSMVEYGKKFGKSNAAKNLQHFLDGSGSDLAMSSTFLLSNSPVRNRVKANMNKIMCGIQRRGKTLSVGQTKTEEICFCASTYANPLTDLYFASGGFTIGTSVQAKIKRVDADKIEYSLTSVSHTFYDPYNWEASKGLTAWVPGFGDVPDSAAYCLEKNGMGKSFIMKTSWSDKDKSGTIYVNGDCVGNPPRRSWFSFGRQDVDGFQVVLLSELILAYCTSIAALVLLCCVCGGAFGWMLAKRHKL